MASALVPGLTQREREAAFALGGVARTLLTLDQVSRLPAGVREWMTSAPRPGPEFLQSLGSFLEADPDGALARLYSSIVRGDHRRPLGTFFTPSAEVKLMLDMWADAEQMVPKAVVDVGAGVGVFTVEAARRWPEARVYAVDINPVTLGLLAVRLLAAGIGAVEQVSARVELVLNDFTLWLRSADAPKPGGRLILGNPPYTRAQLLSQKDRVRLHELTDSLCDTRANLSTLITAFSIQELDATDGLSFLLPAQWLESQYARNLRNLIWRESRRRVELRLVESEDLFDGAKVDAVALLIGTRELSPQPFSVARWRDASRRTLDRTVQNSAEWRSLFSGRAEGGDRVRAQFGQFTLGAFASVHRGIATGANATFLLDRDAAELLPPEATTRVINRLADIPNDAVAEALPSSGRSARWLLTATPHIVASSAAVAAVVRAAEEGGVHRGVLCSRRARWYDLEHELYRPDVIISPMTQKSFRLVTNSTRAVITNNLYGFSWHGEASATTRGRIIDWLRSTDGQAALTSIARRQGAGLLKLEPGALRRLTIPYDVLFEGSVVESACGTTVQSASSILASVD